MSTTITSHATSRYAAHQKQDMRASSTASTKRNPPNACSALRRRAGARIVGDVRIFEAERCGLPSR